MSSYNVPDLAPGEIHREEEVIRRSRFIVSMARVQGPDQAKAFIERIRVEHPDATHNCWAFQAGPAGSTAFAGCSDDGEPKGTAGRPMLTVLLHCGVGEIAAVVTRYFGGTLLGTGGLVHAYQGMVKKGPCDRTHRNGPDFRGNGTSVLRTCRLGDRALSGYDSRAKFRSRCVAFGRNGADSGRKTHERFGRNQRRKNPR